MRYPKPTRAAKKPKRRILPRCKHCAHPYSRHWISVVTGRPNPMPGDGGCERCSFCPEYAPARGIRQKRRTPAAACRDRADHLWSAIVHARPEFCEVQHYHSHKCEGGYQAMHGIPRGYGATRFAPVNGFKGCAGVHKYFSEHKEEWTVVLLTAWGRAAFDELWALARSSAKQDMPSVLSKLRAEAARLGIE